MSLNQPTNIPAEWKFDSLYFSFFFFFKAVSHFEYLLLKLALAWIPKFAYQQWVN